MYTVKTIEATDTTAESYEVTFTSEYANPIAQVFGLEGNKAETIRNILESATLTGEAEHAAFTGGMVDLLIEAEQELQDNEDKKALASLKATLAKASREMYGFGAKIHQGKLVGTKVGAGKGAKTQKSELVTAVELFETTATPEQESEMLELVKGAIALYAKKNGATLKTA